jgi:uncharacterized membrane protein YqjE
MYQRFIKSALTALSLLFIPFIAMQLSDQIAWSFLDFVIMGCMLTVYALLSPIHLIICMDQKNHY